MSDSLSEVAADPDALLLRIMIDPASIPDPHPLYRALREAAPVFRTEMTGTWIVSAAVTNKLPRSPRVRITWPVPRSSKRRAAVSASATVPTGWPTRSSVSLSLGQKISLSW